MSTKALEDYRKRCYNCNGRPWKCRAYVCRLTGSCTRKILWERGLLCTLFNSMLSDNLFYDLEDS